MISCLSFCDVTGALLCHWTLSSITAVQKVIHQYNTFWGDQRSERDGWPCTCEIATGYLQLTCAWHPANQTLTVYQIWAQSVQPFPRSGTVALHVCTCKVDPNLLYHATQLTGPHKYTKFERNRSSRSRDLDQPLPCTCARADRNTKWERLQHNTIGASREGDCNIAHYRSITRGRLQCNTYIRNMQWRKLRYIT